MATSKSCWAGMERHIAKILGTTRQYGQSAKGSRFRDQSMLGDVKTARILIECKLRDYAPKAFRKKHPRKFYSTFRAQNAWWTGIKKEAKQADRIPALIIKPKFSQDENMIVIMTKNDLTDLATKAGGRDITTKTNTMNKVLKSSVRFIMDRDGLPWEFEINGDCLIALPWETFLEIESAWRANDSGTTG